MITFRLTADIKDDRRIALTLPPEVPTGKAELVISIESPNGKQTHPRGVPASVIRGIAAGSGAPPSDETIEQWLHERRVEKFG